MSINRYFVYNECSNLTTTNRMVNFKVLKCWVLQAEVFCFVLFCSFLNYCKYTNLQQFISQVQVDYIVDDRSALLWTKNNTPIYDRVQKLRHLTSVYQRKSHQLSHQQVRFPFIFCREKYSILVTINKFYLHDAYTYSNGKSLRLFPALMPLSNLSIYFCFKH